MAEYYYSHSEDEKINEYEIPKENYYVEEIGCFERFDDMLVKVEKKDVVYVHHITDLGDEFQDIMMRWKQIYEEKKADIVTLNKPRIDTRKLKYSRLEYFIYLLHLTEKIDNDIWYQRKRSQQQAQAMEKAKENGSQVGRVRKYTLEEFEKEYNKLAREGLMDRDISKKLGIHPATCTRYKQRLEKKKES